MEESVLFTFPFRTYGNHASELSTHERVRSKRSWNGTFNFTEIINNYGLKQGTLC